MKDGNGECLLDYQILWEAEVKVPGLRPGTRTFVDASVKEASWVVESNYNFKFEATVTLLIGIEGQQEKFYHDIKVTDLFLPQENAQISTYNAVTAVVETIEVLENKLKGEGKLILTSKAYNNTPLFSSPPFANISGVARYEDIGLPVKDGVIKIYNESGLVIGTITDKQGFFSVYRVLPGKYRVELISDGGERQVEEIQVGSGDDLKLEFFLRPISNDWKDWPMLCASPTRNGFSGRYHSPFKVPVVKEWQTNVDGFILSSPVSYNGNIFLCAIGNGGTQIVSISSDQGSINWRFKIKEDVFATPIIASDIDGSDLLYVVSLGSKGSREYAPGSVMAFDPLKGSLIWSINGLGHMYASPLLVKDVYLGSKRRNILCVATYEEEGLHALDAATGESVWSEPQKGLGNIFSSPASAHGLIYVASQQGKVYAIDILTGEKRWTKEVNGNVVATLSVSQGKVYVALVGNGKKGGVIALNAGTGEEIWKFDVGDVVTTPVSDGGRIYFAAVSRELYGLRLSGTAFALDCKSGKEEWSIGLEDILASPSLVGGELIMASVSGNVYCMRAEDGTKLWSARMGGPTIASPAISEDSIIVCGGRRIASFSNKKLNGKINDNSENKLDIFLFFNQLMYRLPKRLTEPLFKLFIRSGINI